jgi:hypothetical protein
MQAGTTANIEKILADDFFPADQPPQAAYRLANLGFPRLFGKFRPVSAKGEMRLHPGQVCFIRVHRGHYSLVMIGKS